MLRRRALLRDLVIGGSLVSMPSRQTGIAAAATDAASPFSRNTVADLARDLSSRPYAAPDAALPRQLAEAGYDVYRTLVYDRAKALWVADGLRFQAQPFHRGFLFKPRVDLYEVSDATARPISYDPGAFNLSALDELTERDLGFAGVRLTHPLNRPDHFDEVIAFLGASYFRAIGRGHVYGLSARGLALRTADPRGEEFPFFKAFWLQRPRHEADAAVVHALLDSPSVTGAYSFTIRPGEATVVDVEARLFPRVELQSVGIAPLTSMFYFSPLDRRARDDYRGAVHDSDGLLVATGRGEVLWRPLSNPLELGISILADVNPRGFGLMQRRRKFAEYGDLEARYEQRPSAWVEPVGDWGSGAVHLVEIPTAGEIHDNIVAFWRPSDPIRPGAESAWTYRLHWTGDLAVNTRGTSTPPAQFTTSSAGASLGTRTARLFVLEVKGPRLAALSPEASPVIEVTTSAGRIANAVARPNPETGGWRLSFELMAGTARSAELRALLKGPDGPLTETWLFRWTA